MKIGFIKFGLKTYFTSNQKDYQGSNHELVNIFNIFEEKGHQCKMISGSDIGGDINYKPDIYFVFNGPIPNYKSSMNTIMFGKYSTPFINLLNLTDKKYIYFRTDLRKEYDINKNILFTHKPEIILSQGKENYGHLEKLICYKNPIRKNVEKTKLVSIIANETFSDRKKDILSACLFLDDVEIIGKWKENNIYVKDPIQFKEIPDYLDKVKYSFNKCEVDWVTQKYYEMIISNVICFWKNNNNNQTFLSKDNFRIVKNEIELTEKIDLLEKDNNIYKKELEKQQNEITEDIVNGDFIYNIIMEHIKNLKL